MKVCLVCIYNSPDLFPPTLNAISSLCDRFDEVYVLYRGGKEVSLNDNKRARYLSVGEETSGMSIWEKISLFFKYRAAIRKIINSKRVDLVLVFDEISLLAVWPSSDKNGKIWYHSHDVPEPGNFRKLSVGWLASKLQSVMFRDVDIFSIPTLERAKFYKTDSFKGRQIEIPNYPSLRFFQEGMRYSDLKDELRLLYQGTISEGHGFEELLEVLGESISGKRLTMTLIGSCDPAYKRKLLELAICLNVIENFSILDRIPYAQLISFTREFHIGLGIYVSKNIMNATIATASNKIYEYIASGLPVLLLDNDYFRTHFGQYDWALFTDLSKSNLNKVMEDLIGVYSSVADAARSDFERSLNFERGFNRALDIICSE
jgi:hypothetical protein